MIESVFLREFSKNAEWALCERTYKSGRAMRDFVLGKLPASRRAGWRRQWATWDSERVIKRAKRTQEHLEILRKYPDLLARRDAHATPPGTELTAGGDMMMELNPGSDISGLLYSVAAGSLALIGDPTLIDKLAPSLMRGAAKALADAGQKVTGKYPSLQSVSDALKRARETTNGPMSEVDDATMNRFVDGLLEHYSSYTGLGPVVQAAVLRARAGLPFAGPTRGAGRWGAIRAAARNWREHRGTPEQVEKARRTVHPRGPGGRGERVDARTAVRRSMGLSTSGMARMVRPNHLLGQVGNLTVRNAVDDPNPEADVSIVVVKKGGVTKYRFVGAPGVLYSTMAGAETARFQMMGQANLSAPKKVT